MTDLQFYKTARRRIIRAKTTDDLMKLINNRVFCSRGQSIPPEMKDRIMASWSKKLKFLTGHK